MIYYNKFISFYYACNNFYLYIIGAIAQLAERLHRIQEVGGAIPLGSTDKNQ